MAYDPGSFQESLSVSQYQATTGTSATFTSNGLSYIDVTTTTSSIVNVPITITNGGFTRIVASSNF